MRKPESIEHAWDVLYRDYPDVYEEWGQIVKKPTIVQVIDQHFPLRGMNVVDVGSGSGISTFELALYAGFVTGIEPEDGMREIAVESQQSQRAENVRFQKGFAEDLPLEDRSVDAAVAITLASTQFARDAEEMERVTRPGGIVIRADVAPGWYGGELNPVITGQPRDETPARGSYDEVLAGRGYGYLDAFLDQDYGTVASVVRTYGFIHGKRVIEYITEHEITSIRWKFRIFHKRIESA